MKLKTDANAELRKIVVAVARTQGGGVVDLPQIESDVRVAILVQAIDEVKERFAAVADAVDPIPAGFAELTQRTLQALDQKLNEEIFQRLTSSVSEEDRALSTRLRAEHRAARGVKKVRGQR